MRRNIRLVYVRKSDGAALYATSDLATIIEREQDFHPDRLQFTSRQAPGASFYPGIRVAKKAGIVKEYADDLSWLRYDDRQGRWSVQDT